MAGNSTKSKTSSMSSAPGKRNLIDQDVPKNNIGARPNPRGTAVQGGRGIQGYSGGNYGLWASQNPIAGALRKGATSMTKAAKKAAPAAVKKAVVKPAAQVVRNTVNAKPSPMMKTMPIRQGGLGVTTGKVTGTSATRLGTGGKTPMTAYQRQQQNALLKGSAFGMLGPSFSKAATSTASRSNSALGGGGGSGSAGAASGKSIADRRSSIAGGPNSTGYSNKGQPGSIR